MHEVREGKTNQHYCISIRKHDNSSLSSHQPVSLVLGPGKKNRNVRDCG